MATPTISAISPAAGHTGGETLVEIDGTNFRTPTPQVAVRGVVPSPPPSVSVKFGGVPALRVDWVKPSLLRVVTPAQPPSKDASGNGTLPTIVDVTVTNIDDTGQPIAGEAFVLAQGYTYVLPDLTIESDLTRLIRTWIRLMKAQVTPNVSWPKQTDFEQTTGDTLAFANLPGLPGLIVADTILRTNDFYAERAPIEIDNGDGTFTTKAPPDTVDIVFTIVGVSNAPPELLNLAATFQRFLRKNPRVAMLRDPLNPALGSVQYDLEWHEGKEVRVTALANQNNLEHWAYEVAILGFDIEDMPGLPLGGPGDPNRQHEATIAVTHEAETITLLPSLGLPPEGPPQS